MEVGGRACYLCYRGVSTVVHTFYAPPAGETDFGVTGYQRTLSQCDYCLHVTSAHGYAGLTARYGEATYRDLAGAYAAYVRLTELPAWQSDNFYRTCAVLRAYYQQRGRPLQKRMLDVGSGLGVFPARMRLNGWMVQCVEPDPVLATHLRALHLPVHEGLWATGPGLLPPFTPSSFDLITMVKVVEHVPQPVVFVADAEPFLAPHGLVYVEVPSIRAAHDPEAGWNREEFFIEHLHIFSPISLTILARRAGFTVVDLEDLREPSGKYTLRAMLGRT